MLYWQHGSDVPVACHVQAAQHWELALRVNPLHPEGWFSLGYCALKQKDFSRALQAFSRCAQQQPDNGDAWNNLAAIHLQVRTPHVSWCRHPALLEQFCKECEHVWQVQ